MSRSRPPSAALRVTSFLEGDVMEFVQRETAPEVSAEADQEARLWLADDERVKPIARDSYVVVDELDEGVIELVVAGWPRLDGRGRLEFPRRRRSVAVSEEALNKVVAQRGKRADGVERSVRIGDAFCVRGEVGRSPANWGRLVDVSGEARDQAKIAFHAAVAPRATPREVRALRLDQEPEPPGPAVETATVARPAI